ncbi:peptidylprolyl isomerase [bacterium]|nr:peptidylprolyl isomerase [bacterium]
MRFITIWLILLAPVVLLAQGVPDEAVPDEAVLARVGDAGITAGEFRLRYALSVFPYKDQAGLTPVVKRQFLYSLVAERLLASEARRLGYDAEDRFRRNLRMAEEMFARDLLYRDSVRAKVQVSAADVRARYLAEQKAVEFDFLRFDSEQGARNVGDILRGGTPFDTLLAVRMRSGTANDAASESAPEPALLQAMDTLCSGCVSNPLKGDDGWYLLRRRVRQSALPDDYSFDAQYKRIENTLRNEREATESVAFVQRLWEGRQAQMDETWYRRLGEALLADYRRQYARGDDMMQASDLLFDSLRSTWRSDLDAAFARVGSDVLTLGEALDRLAQLDLRLKREQADLARRLYRERVRDMLDRFVVTRKAYALGLQRDSEVRNQLTMWTANGLAQSVPDLLFEQFVADDDSLWHLYITRPDLFGAPVEVRILQAHAGDSSRIATAVKTFQEGETLERIAKQLRKEGENAAFNGASDWFAVSERGRIGRLAFGMRIADGGGPVAADGGYTFFQLLDRRYPGMRLSGMQALRDTVARKEGPQIRRARTDQLLRRLAGRSSIRIDAAMLDALQPAAMQMHTVRLLGFGGRIPAMPGVMPLYEAVMEGMMQAGKEVP